jgi:hypothetical protein
MCADSPRRPRLRTSPFIGKQMSASQHYRRRLHSPRPCMEQAKRLRKNSPTCRDAAHLWPDAVWGKFQLQLALNQNSRGGAYYTNVPMGDDLPPTLQGNDCYYPTKSAAIT